MLPRMTSLFRRISLVVLLMAIYGQMPQTAHAQASLTIFAAASLAEAFTEIGAVYEADHPGVDLVFNFGGSSMLAAQLVEGAPADVFASANATQMHVVRDAGLLGAPPRTFVKNRLIVIVPADNPAGIASLRDLAAAGVQLVVAAPGVPVRDYTDTLLERLAASPDYGEPYRQAVLANIVSEEDNVRQVAAKVALGEADAGVVYRSDVTPDIAPYVQMLPIPDVLNTIAAYPIAPLQASANPELAQAFIDQVLSEAGQETLVRWGFISARIPRLPDTVTLPVPGLLAVEGQVLNPLSLTAADLRAFSAQTREVTYQAGEEVATATFTGVLLWDVLNAAQPNLNADIRNDALSMFVVVTGRDGYQAVISWGEIDPVYAAQPVLLAYEQDGTAIDDALGPVRLVVPSDVRDGRYVRGVASISLRDAPGAAQ